MSINNFDQSSSGINLDLDIMRDEDLARENFNDLLQPIKVVPHKQFDFYAVDLGNDCEPFEFTDPTQYDFNRERLNCALGYDSAVLEAVTKQIGGSPFTSRVTKAQLIAALQSALSAEELAAFFFNNFPQRFEAVPCYGYSQGDLVCVIYGRQEVAEMVKAHGKEWPDLIDIGDLREELCDIIYRQPIWGSFKVCAGAYEREYMVDQFLENPYHYDRDQILAGYAQAGEENAEIAAAAYAFLETNLPKSL